MGEQWIRPHLSSGLKNENIQTRTSEHALFLEPAAASCTAHASNARNLPRRLGTELPVRPVLVQVRRRRRGARARDYRFVRFSSSRWRARRRRWGCRRGSPARARDYRFVRFWSSRWRGPSAAPGLAHPSDDPSAHNPRGLRVAERWFHGSLRCQNMATAFGANMLEVGPLQVVPHWRATR